MKRLAFALLLIGAFVLPVAAQDKALAGPDLLRKLEADFAHAVAEHGHDAFVAYFAEDGVELERKPICATKPLGPLTSH